MIVAAVPVKDLVNAKQRLMGVLSPSERRDLAQAMLTDVLRAVAEAALDHVWVVTREPAVAAIARRFGAEPLAESENRGHTAAVANAQAAAGRAGADAFLRKPIIESTFLATIRDTAAAKHLVLMEQQK